MTKAAAQAKRGGWFGKWRWRNRGQEVFPEDGQQEEESTTRSGNCMHNSVGERKVMDRSASRRLTKQNGGFVLKS